MILEMKIMLLELEEDVDMVEDLINILEIGRMKKHMRVEVLLKTPIKDLLPIMLPVEGSKKGSRVNTHAPIEVDALNVVEIETQITEVAKIEDTEAGEEIEVTEVKPEQMLE